MLLAFVLCFVVIITYTRIVTPPPSKDANQRRIAENTPPTQETVQEVKEVPKNADVLEVRRSAIPGKLSTVDTKSMSVGYSAAGGCISNATLYCSEIIKKGPVELVAPLLPLLQPIALSVYGGAQVDGDSIYDLLEEKPKDGYVGFKKAFGPLVVVKRFKTSQQGFVIDSTIEFENAGSENISLSGINVSAGAVFALTHAERDSYVGVDVFGENGSIHRIAGSKLNREKKERAAVKWLALRNQFFSIVLKPKKGGVGYSAAAVRLANGRKGVRGAIELASLELKPGEKKEIQLSLYIGPKEYTALSSFGALDVIDFGWFGFLGRWILIGLNMLFRVCGNYGVAIILLTIIIRAILYPLNQKSFRSMKAMQNLQPEIAGLQAKYKDDPKKKQEEMMRIYKKHGINPMGGCLPLLIQMPILIAFFRVLQNAIELWGAPFYLWIKDLSEPDALFKMSTGKNVIPFIGRVVDGQAYVFLNVLPIVMLAVFYIQQKMSPTGMGTTAEQQQQQKLMSYMMPVMFGVIFYNMPAGLNLYFAASTLLGILQQKYMIR